MTTKVYVGNLAFSVTDKELKEAFSTYGEITEVTIIIDKFSGRSKGFGFITFADDASANKAVSEMNDKELQGRAMKVNIAKPMEERPPRKFNRY
jgi:RNA recognition motif-containing protein